MSETTNETKAATPASRLAELQRLAGEAGLRVTDDGTFKCCMQVSGDGCITHRYCHGHNYGDGGGYVIDRGEKPWTNGTPADCINAVLATRPQPITPPPPAPATLEQYQAVASEVDEALTVEVSYDESSYAVDIKGDFPGCVQYWHGGMYEGDIDHWDKNADRIGQSRKGTFHDACVYAASLLPAEQEPAEASGEGEKSTRPAVVGRVNDNVLIFDKSVMDEWEKSQPVPCLYEPGIEAAVKQQFFFPCEFVQERWDENSPGDEYTKGMLRTKCTRIITAYLSALSHTPAQHPGVATVGQLEAAEREVEKLRREVRLQEVEFRVYVQERDKLRAERDAARDMLTRTIAGRDAWADALAELEKWRSDWQKGGV